MVTPCDAQTLGGELTGLLHPRALDSVRIPTHPVGCSGVSGHAALARATGAALVLPYVNTEPMSARLAEISRHVSHGVHAIVCRENRPMDGFLTLLTA